MSQPSCDWCIWDPQTSSPSIWHTVFQLWIILYFQETEPIRFHLINIFNMLEIAFIVKFHEWFGRTRRTKTDGNFSSWHVGKIDQAHVAAQLIKKHDFTEILGSHADGNGVHIVFDWNVLSYHFIWKIWWCFIFTHGLKHFTAHSQIASTERGFVIAIFGEPQDINEYPLYWVAVRQNWQSRQNRNKLSRRF